MIGVGWILNFQGLKFKDPEKLPRSVQYIVWSLNLELEGKKLGLRSHKDVTFLPILHYVQPHFRKHAFGIRPCHCAKWKDMEHAVILHMSTQESPSSCF